MFNKVELDLSCYPLVKYKVHFLKYTLVFKLTLKKLLVKSINLTKLNANLK